MTVLNKEPKSILTQEYLPGNILTRIGTMEDLSREKDLEDAPTIEETTGGRLGVFDLMISPAEGVTVTEPTDTRFTGYFVAGNGILFGSDTYVSGNVVAGVIKTGFTDVGTLYAIDAVIEGTVVIGPGSEAGGWLIDATRIYNDDIQLDSSIPAILIGDATDVSTGAGVFIGNDSGTYKMRIGDPSANYLLWNGTTLATSGQWISSAGMNPALQEWQTNIVFSSASDVQVNWTSGTLILSDGTTYSIVSGNTGTMAALTYIYLDISISSTVFQITTTYTTATGDGKILVAAAQNATAGASVLIFSGQQPIINGGAQITALSILAGNIAAGAVTATKISVSNLSAITAAMGSLTIDSLLTMSGENGAITIGTTPPSSATSGTGFWIDRTGIYSLLAGVQQTTLSEDGLSAGIGAVTINYNGILLRNGAFSDSEASISMNDLGWIYNQTSVANGNIRQMRMGLRDNLSEPEGDIQYFTPGADITITNYNFANMDMTGWTEVERGTAKAALGTLSTSFNVAQIIFLGDDLYAALQGGATTSSVWKWTAATQTWAAYGALPFSGSVCRTLAVIGNDIYAGGQGFTTSSVWVSIAGANFVPYGTLSTAFDVWRLLAVGSDLYASRSSGVWTISSVWKSSSGGAWAAYGTLTTTFSDVSLFLLGTDIYAGIASGATTSSVWKSASGGAWAAYGTLSTSFSVRSLAIIGSDLYAGIASGATTSSVWKSASGGAWAAYGTLSTSFLIYGLLAIGNDLYAAGRSFTASGIWKSYDGDAWAYFGNLSTAFQVSCMVNNGYDLYLGIGSGGSTLTSNVWVIDVDSWDASLGYAQVTNVDTTVPEIEMETRFPVTVADKLEIKASTSATITGGTIVITVGVKFYTASSGGSLVSTVTAFMRTLTADGVLQEGFGYVTVPATATHAVIFGKFSNTAGISTTCSFDRFKARIVNGLVELVFDNGHLWVVQNEIRMPLPGGVIYANNLTGNISTSGQTTIFAFTLPANFFAAGGRQLRFKVNTKSVMTTSRVLTARLTVGGTTLTMTASGGTNSKIVDAYEGSISRNSANVQEISIVDQHWNATAGSFSGEIGTGTAANTDSATIDVTFTLQLAGAVTSGIYSGVNVTAVQDVDVY